MAYRLGIAGVGGLTQRQILPALREIGIFEVVGALDIDPAQLAAVTEKFPDAFTTVSEQEFFEQPMDAIYIATPNATHAHYTIQALERGMAVLVEKPCSDTLAAARAMLEAARQASRPVLVGYMSKQNRYNRTAQKLLEQGAIGELLGMSAVFGFEYYDPPAWRFHKKDSGFGALSDIGIYPVTTALDLFGETPLSCSAQAYPADDETWTDRFLSGRVAFSKNRWLDVTVSFVQKQDSMGYTLVGTSGTIHVSGSWGRTGEGELVLNDKDGFKELTAEVVNPYAEEFKCLHACLEGEPVPPEMSLDRGVEDMAVLDALNRSAASRGEETKVDSAAE